ncbi:MAG: queuosine precursor transporter [Flavobacteriia bacterium]|nr:queuosine precursor transporter [Flavobacteriia bacterium]
MKENKRNNAFIFLSAIFITNAVLAELIGGKLISFFGVFVQSLGIILWPIVFLLTDLLNEFYGKKAVQRLSFITVFCILFTFVVLFIANSLHSVSNSPVNDSQFSAVFIQSQWIIFGSVVAFIVSQLIDVHLFILFKKLTGSKMIWLRATGSTLLSQLFDTFIVQFIAFVIPGIWKWNQFVENASMGYMFKLLLALSLTPFIYLGQYILRKYFINSTIVNSV